MQTYVNTGKINFSGSKTKQEVTFEYLWFRDLENFKNNLFFFAATSTSTTTTTTTTTTTITTN